jgi:cytoskeletal protein RodZ
MGEEKTSKKGRSVALSGVIGFVLVALLIGMIIGGAVTLLVITPYISQLHQQGNDNQATTGNQNSNYQNGNNNQGPTSTPNNQSNTGNQNNSQNNSQSQGINNSNPAITNPTGQYSSTGSQFSVTTPDNGTQASGTISANVNCVVQQSGNSIQLDLTITPTSVPQSLSQAIQNSPVTFNFGGTISGSQFSAQASGTGGSDPASPTFNLNLSGSFGSNTLTITVTSASGSQISISTPHSVILQSN